MIRRLLIIKRCASNSLKFMEHVDQRDKCAEVGKCDVNKCRFLISGIRYVNKCIYVIMWHKYSLATRYTSELLFITTFI